MTLVVATIGLPAAGKTEFSKRWVREDVAWRVRVCRDDLRDMLHDGIHIVDFDGDKVTERVVVMMRDAIISSALKSRRDVVIDETALTVKTRNHIAMLAKQYGATVEWKDFRDIPLGVCLERNRKRGLSHDANKYVPEDYIKEMHAKYIARTQPLVDLTDIPV